MPLRIDRIVGDRPFAEIERPALAVADEHRGLLGVAGTPTWHRPVPVAVVRRPDWSAVTASSLAYAELAGPRVPAPRSDGSLAARATLTRAGPRWEPRRTVRAVEQLQDGRILAALDGVALESWLASGEREWSASGVEGGGREIVVEEDREMA
ncbi:MAG TPA: hypothetical protein VF223_16780 [Trebonia sp.]